MPINIASCTTKTVRASVLINGGLQEFAAPGLHASVFGLGLGGYPVAQGTVVPQVTVPDSAVAPLLAQMAPYGLVPVATAVANPSKFCPCVYDPSGAALGLIDIKKIADANAALTRAGYTGS